MVLCAISGVVIVSLITVSIQSFCEFYPNEEKVAGFIDRINSKEEINRVVAKYFNWTFKFFVQKQKYLRESNHWSKKQKLKVEKNLLFLVSNQLKLKKKFKKTLQ